MAKLLSQSNKPIFEPRYKEEPELPVKKTLSTLNCFFCNGVCYNGTIVPFEGQRYIVRYCNGCKDMTKSSEKLAEIKNKNLLIPFESNATAKARPERKAIEAVYE